MLHMYVMYAPAAVSMMTEISAVPPPPRLVEYLRKTKRRVPLASFMYHTLKKEQLGHIQNMLTTHSLVQTHIPQKLTSCVALHMCMCEVRDVCGAAALLAFRRQECLLSVPAASDRAWN